MAVKPTTKKKVTKKKVTKKAATKKKVTKKKKKVDKNDLWLTKEEALTVRLGISEQRRCDDKIAAEASKLELFIRDSNKTIAEKKALIKHIEEDKRRLVKEYKEILTKIKKRLNFSGNFGFNPETGQILLNDTLEKPE